MRRFYRTIYAKLAEIPMKKYIWQNPKYPDFSYDSSVILPLLSTVRLKQGYLLGKMEGIGFENHRKTLLNVLTEDVIKSNEIEGLKLNLEQVRSSIAKKLGLDFDENVYVDRNIDGFVDMMFDATQEYNKKLTEERLFSWQAAMFPTGRSGLHKIKTGEYRDDRQGPMQVVSGAIGHEKVHYEAPPANQLDSEMKNLIDYINNESKTDLILKAGIVHLWFVIIHPFEDGNGRIARALADMLLARSENSKNRFYSMSSQINKVRKSYYKALELTQSQSLDITDWLKWFLENLLLAITSSETLFKDVMQKAEFWQKHRHISMNERQVKIINKLLDYFEGKLTTTKWAKICNCSQDTATRDITDLISKGILQKQGEARATHYIIKN